MSHRLAILDGLRTPFCKVGGVLKDLGADDLGAIVVRELVARARIEPKRVDELIFGNVAQPAHAANVARVIGLKAGLPTELIAHTVHRNCASGMQSLTAAALQIQTGQAELVMAGGTESMSQIPLLFGPGLTRLFIRLAKAKTLGGRLKAMAAFRPSQLKPVIALQLGLTDPVCGLNMGQTAELLACEFGISRDEQDAFALANFDGLPLQVGVEVDPCGSFNVDQVRVIQPLGPEVYPGLVAVDQVKFAGAVDLQPAVVLRPGLSAPGCRPCLRRGVHWLNLGRVFEPETGPGHDGISLSRDRVQIFHEVLTVAPKQELEIALCNERRPRLIGVQIPTAGKDARRAALPLGHGFVLISARRTVASSGSDM